MASSPQPDRSHADTDEPKSDRPPGHLQITPVSHDPGGTEDTLSLARRLLASLQGGAAGLYSSAQDELLLLERLRDRLDATLEVEPNRFSVVHAASALHFVRHCASRHGLPMRAANHLEFGSGALAPYGRMFTHVLLGADRATCIELDEIHDPRRAVRHLARLAAAALLEPERLAPGFALTREQALANLRGFDLGGLAQGEAAALGERLRLARAPIQRTGLPDASFDATFSNSVLEHLSDVDAALAELRRVTKPGGFGVHGIDVSDHSRYWLPDVHPLQFLCEDPSHALVHECNRLRLSDFEALFAKHGFTVVEAWRDDPQPVPDELRRRMARPWRDKDADDLGRWWAQYLVRRD